MRRWIIIATLCAFVAAPAAAYDPGRGVVIPSHADFIKGNYWALVIGINEYLHWPGLHTARKDAEELARILVDRYRFGQERVKLLVDSQATRANYPFRPSHSGHQHPQGPRQPHYLLRRPRLQGRYPQYRFLGSLRCANRRG